MALEEFMQYYGQLDATGQNNLLRDRFAQHVGYAQVDRYVPTLENNGRQPYDVEIADLQNAAMSSGNGDQKVNPNDNHMLHLQEHLPSLEDDLGNIESTSPTDPNLVHVAVLKTAHSAQHMKMLKPDKLNEALVNEIGRKFNNLAERTSAAVERLERQQQKQAQQQQQDALAQAKQQGAAEMQQKLGPQIDKTRQQVEAGQQKMRMDAEAHQQEMRHNDESHNQDLALNDAKMAAALQTPTPPAQP
jgi:hypothetical protein